jgi:hypothetical protein
LRCSTDDTAFAAAANIAIKMLSVRPRQPLAEPPVEHAEPTQPQHARTSAVQHDVGASIAEFGRARLGDALAGACDQDYRNSRFHAGPPGRAPGWFFSRAGT